MKHHYEPWSEEPPTSGLAKLAVQPGEAHSHCKRCRVMVKVGRVGGVKFWVAGKWTSKRPPCEPKPG